MKGSGYSNPTPEKYDGNKSVNLTKEKKLLEKIPNIFLVVFSLYTLNILDFSNKLILRINYSFIPLFALITQTTSHVFTIEL